MPLLGFQSRFADLVERGEKRQTIRAYRKDGRDPKAGDRLYLWTGLRQPGARKLGEATCLRAQRVDLGSGGSIAMGFDLLYPRDPFTLNECNRERFAKADGFASFADMVEWFRKAHGLPFRGLLIEWGEIEPGGEDGA